jgi:hypothetical protein
MSLQDLTTTAAALTNQAQIATTAAGPSQSSAMHNQAANAHLAALNAWVPTGITAMQAQHQVQAAVHQTTATTLKAAGK